MIAFSPGIAQGAFELLNITTRQQLSFLDIQISFKRLGGMSVAQVCDVAQRFNWVHVDQDGFLRATNAGLIILSLPDYPSKLRQALLDYIEVEKPAWLQNVTFGRQRVLKFADICLVQVFIEAGLVDGISIDVVEFWDILAAAARNRKNDRATEIGRMGERLTLEYEVIKASFL